MSKGQTDIYPKVRLFLSSPDYEGLFGSGKWILLDAIRKEGSLQKAAKRLNRGYRKAWGDICIAEKGLGFPIIRRIRGGKDGGHSELTPEGVALLEAWDRFHAASLETVDKLFKKIIKPVIKPGPKGAKK